MMLDDKNFINNAKYVEICTATCDSMASSESGFYRYRIYLPLHNVCLNSTYDQSCFVHSNNFTF